MKVAAARLMRLAAEVMPQRRVGFIRNAGRNLPTTRASLAALAPLVEADPRQPVPEALLESANHNPYGGASVGDGISPSVGRMGADLLKAAGWALETDPDLSRGADLYLLAGDLLLAAPEAKLDAELVALWPYLERTIRFDFPPGAPAAPDDASAALMKDSGFMALLDRVAAMGLRDPGGREWDRAHLARLLAPIWLARSPAAHEPLPENQTERLMHAAAAPRMDWALPTLIPGEWTHLSPADAAVVLTLVGEAERLGEKRWPLTLEHACDRVRSRSLACYGGALLFELQGYGSGGEPGLMSVLMAGDRLFVAEGTSAPLHHATDAVGLRLDTPDARRDFLVLFAGWVSSGEGRFHVIATERDLAPRFTGSPEQWDAVAPLIAPLEDLGRGEDGRWGFDATVLYGDALFRARFRLNEIGQVVMTDEEMLAHGLPVNVEVRDGPLVHLRTGREDA